MYSKWHMHWYDSNLWTYHKEITNYDWKMYMKEKIRLKKIAKMTVTENWDDGYLSKKIMISYGHLSDFLKSDFLFHIHFSLVICDFLVETSSITIVLMHVSFKIHYRNNLIDKKDSTSAILGWQQLQLSALPQWWWRLIDIH